MWRPASAGLREGPPEGGPHTEVKVPLKPDTTTAVCVLSLICVLSGCSSSQKAQSPSATTTQAKTPDGRDLRPVELPDLSQMAPSAQKQIRDQYASLQQTIANHPNVVDLSRAYGEMGKLLMAADRKSTRLNSSH